MRTGDAPDVCWDHITEIASTTITAAVFCVCPTSQEAVRDYRILKARIEDGYRRIKGNRAVGTRVTWHDVRLILASDLRVVLEYLESDL